MVIDNTMAWRIKTLRKQLGISQPMLALKIGVSHSTLSRWEKGHRRASVSQIEQLANILNVSAGMLAFGTTDDLAVSIDSSLPKVPNLTGQENVVVAFQGESGAYSHLATKSLYPNSTILPCRTFADAFGAVEDGSATYAVIPIENSLGGRVADIHHLLPESNLYTVGEYFQVIEHCLLGVKGANIADITSVYSHEQALSQCRHTLRDMNIVAEKYADTAGAANFISKDKDLHKGALASQLAGEIYGLSVLKKNMEDSGGNTTRFVVLSSEEYKPNPQAGKIITSCIFFTRDIPASLYKALGGFATNGVNILKIESYVPMLEKSGDAHFYVEFLGSPTDTNIALALDELKFYTTNIHILGTYTENR